MNRRMARALPRPWFCPPPKETCHISKAITLASANTDPGGMILVIPPGSVLADANVIALEMWQVSFGGGQNQGLGSALAILLFILVLPAMAFNLRRFRAEQ